MLQEVIDLQNGSVVNLLYHANKKDEVTFKAPTGSGKTHMMADFMDRVIADDEDVIFIVSSLSKGDLAKQNFEKFEEYVSKKDFLHINPFMISSETSGENRLFIPTDYNVYVLPRDLYKDKSKLKQGALADFLIAVTSPKPLGLGKKIYVIKDECHIATSNLDSLKDKYFTKVFNFSATPKLSRGQRPDVELKEEDAIQAHLIKKVEYQDENESLDDALTKFEAIKTQYHKLLGINPCMIIQISNKDKAEEELKDIFNTLSINHADLKWMLIVDDDKKCDTNDMMKAKGLPVSKWKDHVKTSASVIDVIIFKMVITEGWDIPRACMLYQARNSRSKQLDEQVIGRIRRNPKLLQFESLSQAEKDLISVAYVWGVEDKEHRTVQPVKVAGITAGNEIQQEMKIKTTRIKKDLEKKEFDLPTYLDKQKAPVATESVFSLYKKYKATSNEVKTLSGDYVTNFGEWFKFMNNIDGITQKSKEINCNYSDSMELVTDDKGNPVEVSLPLLSFYTDNEHYVRMNNWIWVRSDSEDKNFSFDSAAEQEWARILVDLTDEDAPTGNGRIIKSVTIKEMVDDEEEMIKRYLFGKNFLSNSDIKFEYYLNGIHASYPDFIMKDYKDRIHLFETKSINQSSELDINKEEYEAKVEALKECYKQASVLTGYYFYLPVQVGSDWQIFRYFNGTEEKMSLREFRKSLKQ